ncbi:MAG: D-alanine-D-alanine ligase [Actinomycetota bacterium]|nr:D-alanine-D-alanine ligase [Actinomycetota bacterium]
MVLFGGQSAEHEVSCVTAASVLGAVDRDRYDIVPVGITPEGRWVIAEDAVAALAAGAKALSPTGREIEPGAKGLAVTGQTVVLPLLHGPLGEDGTVQGMLELAGVPYVGTGVLGSALAMDKAKAREVFHDAGLPVARWLARRDGLIEADLARTVEDALGWPVFVKPSNMGSSVGVTKVKTAADLGAAVEHALSYDEWVVIEEAVVGREVECAVLGNLEPRASVIGEIIPKAEFYDYDDKYSGDGAELVIPADLPVEVSDRARAIAIDAFRVVRAEGFARVDFFYEETGPSGERGRGLLLNEVNTIPGFTPLSMYPRLWDATGVGYVELIDELVRLAVERHDRRNARRGRPRPQLGS